LTIATDLTPYRLNNLFRIGSAACHAAAIADTVLAVRVSEPSVALIFDQTGLAILCRSCGLLAKESDLFYKLIFQRPVHRRV
jgi:hypothetical protein